MARVAIPLNGAWSYITGILDANFTELYYKAADGWHDILGDLNGAEGTLGSNPEPDWEQFTDDGSASVGIYARAFSASAEESLYVNYHIPHGIKNTLIYPHVHWAPSNTDTGVVRWGIEWAYARGYSNGTFGNSQFTILEQAGGGVAKKHQIIETASAVNISGLEPDGMLIARFFRDATHANDTYNADAFGFYCDLHVEIDRMATPNRNYPFG